MCSVLLARLDVTSRIGHTPLHLACRFGHLPVVVLLLAEGAELNARDTDGNTPLHKVRAPPRALQKHSSESYASHTPWTGPTLEVDYYYYSEAQREAVNTE